MFVGPGEKLVLLTQDGKALCVWRKFISKDGQEGINNAIFRNEKAYNGKIKSSVLLIEAEKLALVRWPTAKRFYTYVKPSAIRSSNPGCCYKKAGWKKCGLTKTKSHIIFEKI